MKSFSLGRRSLDASAAVWILSILAAIYPWLLEFFSFFLRKSQESYGIVSMATIMVSLLIMFIAFFLPALGLKIVRFENPCHPIKLRVLALFLFASPTLYVFFGVLTFMGGSPLPDPWVWSSIWLFIGFLIVNIRASPRLHSPARTLRTTPYFRIAHGVFGLITASFIAFHLFNHLFGLLGPAAHAAAMDLGRVFYRSPIGESVLVAAMLFQVASGLYLLRVWSVSDLNKYRLFQVATGIYLTFFILGHMNSVFIFARSFLEIPTDWEFATGGPKGLLFDEWNVRLIPHYSMGVLFALTHLFLGLRVVLLAHGVSELRSNQVLWLGIVFAFLVAVLIMAGMLGVRVG